MMKCDDKAINAKLKRDKIKCFTFPPLRSAYECGISVYPCMYRIERVEVAYFNFCFGRCELQGKKWQQTAAAAVALCVRLIPLV